MADRDTKFYHFDGLAAFADDCERNNALHNASESWAGGTAKDALAYARQGDISQVAKAESLLDQLDSEIDSNSVRPVWMPSVVGNFPIVPAYLAGTPEAMMARSDVPDARGEVEIWANTTVSSSCKARDMMRRGVVTMAFAMALARTRNVKIVLYSTCDKSNVAIRLSSPLDISEVCAAFCQPSITRQLIYGHADLDGFTGHWADWAEVKRSREAERKALGKYAGMPADAVHLSTETLGEYSSMTDDKLVEILNAKIREYMER